MRNETLSLILRYLEYYYVSNLKKSHFKSINKNVSI